MSSINVQPLGNRLLVKRAKKKTNKGGILLPESAQETPKEGEVIATGPGCREENGELKALQVKVGDQVLFGPYSGTEVKTDNLDEEFLLLSEEEIFGILVRS